MASNPAPSDELLESRALMEQHATDPAPEDATATPMVCSGVPVVRLSPSNAADQPLLLHFHGGGFRRGSPRGFASQTARIAKATGTTVFSVEYRLAPENPFPAGLEDAATVYRWLLDTGIPADHIVLWGDSAGGGLAAALLLRIATLGLPQPAGAALFSAWLDLRLSAPSYSENADSDQLFSRAAAAEAAYDYLAGHDPTDPLVSPVLGEWSGQPPLLLFASGIEVLRDDALLLAKTAGADGVDVRLEIFPDPQHVWPILTYPDSEDAVRAVAILTRFLNEILAHTHQSTSNGRRGQEHIMVTKGENLEA